MESQLLSTFLDNLKTMCAIESKQKEKNMKEFVSFAESSKQDVYNLITKKNALISELKEFGASKLFARNNQEDD